MSLPSFEVLLDIVREVSETPFDDLPQAGSILISIVDSLITETDVIEIASRLGVEVSDEFRRVVYDEAVEFILSDPNVVGDLETCIRLKIMIDRWIASAEQ